MRTTIICNSLSELVQVSFPYRFEIPGMFVENEEMTFEEFERRYLKNN